MNLTYKKGNLIHALENREVDVIAHQANCFCTMKSGIAPQIANRWPQVREVDLATDKGDKGKLGHLTYAEVPEGLIFNLYGQYHWQHWDKDYGTNYDALHLALIRMCDTLDDDKVVRVGLPKIGCGLAGGDWGRVVEKIENAFIESNHEIIVYELE